MSQEALNDSKNTHARNPTMEFIVHPAHFGDRMYRPLQRILSTDVPAVEGWVRSVSCAAAIQESSPPAVLL